MFQFIAPPASQLFPTSGKWIYEKANSKIKKQKGSVQYQHFYFQFVQAMIIYFTSKQKKCKCQCVTRTKSQVPLCCCLEAKPLHRLIYCYFVSRLTNTYVVEYNSTIVIQAFVWHEYSSKTFCHDSDRSRHFDILLVKSSLFFDWKITHEEE